MRVCVCEDFLNKVWSSLIELKATEFSKQEKKSMIDQSKVKPYLLLGPNHPHMIHSL
jgi:hypothetical protein